MQSAVGSFVNGPLTGVRVLEIGSTVAGPFCGRLLADFGAEVIKIEAAEGDTVRSMGKRLDGRSLYAASIFRNKALISVDLRRPEGQEVVRRIAAAVDVVVENFRPGGLERWGIGWEQLRAINPGLVMVRISGFGQDGPYAHRPGFGVIGEAVSGLRHVTGDPDRPPARVAVSLTDYITGLYAAFGATMALLVKRQTGRGQYIDAALHECAFSFMEPHIPAYDKLGHVAGRAGSRLPDNTPNNLYPTRDRSFIHIAAVGEPVFRRFAACMGAPELADDPRFSTGVARARHEDALDALVVGWTEAHDLAELERILEAADVPATRIFTMADIFRDPHYAARGAIAAAPDAALGTIAMANVVPRLSATPGRVRHAGGGIVGADTRAVLRRVAGFTEAEIDRLDAAGVVVCAGEAVHGAG
ncbi:MAG: CoA transferase [Alphaproteobacteria bacterium]|nr:CoA transferase [Alphaproteobacteria bacterium]